MPVAVAGVCCRGRWMVFPSDPDSGVTAWPQVLVFAVAVSRAGWSSIGAMLGVIRACRCARMVRGVHVVGFRGAAIDVAKIDLLR